MKHLRQFLLTLAVPAVVTALSCCIPGAETIELQKIDQGKSLRYIVYDTDYSLQDYNLEDNLYQVVFYAGFGEEDDRRWIEVARRELTAADINQHGKWLEFSNPPKVDMLIAQLFQKQGDGWDLRIPMEQVATCSLGGDYEISVDGVLDREDLEYFGEDKAITRTYRIPGGRQIYDDYYIRIDSVIYPLASARELCKKIRFELRPDMDSDAAMLTVYSNGTLRKEPDILLCKKKDETGISLQVCEKERIEEEETETEAETEAFTEESVKESESETEKVESETAKAKSETEKAESETAKAETEKSKPPVWLGENKETEKDNRQPESEQQKPEEQKLEPPEQATEPQTKKQHTSEIETEKEKDTETEIETETETETEIEAEPETETKIANVAETSPETATETAAAPATDDSDGGHAELLDVFRARFGENRERGEEGIQSSTETALKTETRKEDSQKTDKATEKPVGETKPVKEPSEKKKEAVVEEESEDASELKTETVAKAGSEKAVPAKEEKQSEKAIGGLTEKASEKAAEMAPEKPSEKQTEKPTEKLAETMTEKPTEKATEATTEKKTEKTSEAATEDLTERATEEATEQVKETETETETDEAAASNGKGMGSGPDDESNRHLFPIFKGMKLGGMIAEICLMIAALILLTVGKRLIPGRRMRLPSATGKEEEDDDATIDARK